MSPRIDSQRKQPINNFLALHEISVRREARECGSVITLSFPHSGQRPTHGMHHLDTSLLSCGQP